MYNNFVVIVKSLFDEQLVATFVHIRYLRILIQSIVFQVGKGRLIKTEGHDKQINCRDVRISDHRQSGRGSRLRESADSLLAVYVCAVIFFILFHAFVLNWYLAICNSILIKKMSHGFLYFLLLWSHRNSSHCIWNLYFITLHIRLRESIFTKNSFNNFRNWFQYWKCL